MGVGRADEKGNGVSELNFFTNVVVRDTKFANDTVVAARTPAQASFILVAVVFFVGVVVFSFAFDPPAAFGTSRNFWRDYFFDWGPRDDDVGHSDVATTFGNEADGNLEIHFGSNRVGCVPQHCNAGFLS